MPRNDGNNAGTAALMTDDRATHFLNLIRRSQRGRHKIYLGYGPGVGKTTLMLQEGHRLKADGIDVVIGLVEAHGRSGTARLIEGLEMVPRWVTTYHGITVDEMDVDAVLARRPKVALVDELAHTNVPGSRNEKRYQDVNELLAAGIHVISTINVQHLESLFDTVERQIGVKVRERLPDAALAEADEVVNVDLAPEDLQKRLAQGEIYPKERIPSAMENYFQTGNLEQLRELTLRELASQIDFKRREQKAENGSGAPDQIMVCLSSRGPNTAFLLRYASRLAGRLNRTWYAVYVQTSQEDALTIDAATQRHLSETLTLANQLGALVFTFKGDDVPQTILRFAREYRVGHIVIGKPQQLPWWSRLLGRLSVAEQLIQGSAGHTIVIVDAGHAVLEAAVPRATAAGVAAPAGASVPAPAPPPARAFDLGSVLQAQHIVIWEAPVPRTEVLRRLVACLAPASGPWDGAAVLEKIESRERQGSTFLNQGLALPHIRLAGLSGPRMAIGLTHGGISDLTGEPVRMVVLVLSPPEDPSGHLQLLAMAARMHQRLELRRELGSAADAQRAYAAIVAWVREEGDRS
jgi:two-component system sensor histidine kinase KdpD